MNRGKTCARNAGNEVFSTCGRNVVGDRRRKEIQANMEKMPQLIAEYRVGIQEGIF